MLTTQQDSAVPVEDCKSYWALGLMSGTSLDGIDGALIHTDGREVLQHGPNRSDPYTQDQRELFGRAVAAAVALDGPTAEVPGTISSAGLEITRCHISFVHQFLEENSLSVSDIDVIGFHGQTIVHRPEAGWTWQIGDGSALASSLGIPVVADFRQADVAAGGQGAPLATLYHLALARQLGDCALPLAILNIGGVSNVTWIGPEYVLYSFDTGPGNGLLDSWVAARMGARFDRDGALAAAGRVDQGLLDELLAHGYFQQPPPKSLDRYTFSMDTLEALTPADGAATLTAFTVAAVAAAPAHFPAPPKRWLVCGGGRHNRAIMDGLAAALAAPVATVEDVGWCGDALEAEAFGFLAVRSLAGLPLSEPATTGVRSALTGGRLYRP